MSRRLWKNKIFITCVLCERKKGMFASFFPLFFDFEMKKILVKKPFEINFCNTIRRVF